MTNRQDTSQSGLSRFAVPVLAAVVLLQALGLVLTTLREGTPLGTWMFILLKWSEATSIVLERAGTLVAVLASLAAVSVRRPLPRLLAAGVVSAWFTALALGEWRIGGAPFTSLALPAHATRIVAPLLLALWDRRAVAKWALRVGIALTFAIHGWEAYQLHPGFIDFLLAADLRLFGLGLEQQGAELLLRLIGALDVVLAALVLTGRDFRPVLAWAAVWGVVTALSRVVQGGEGAAHMALIRAANGGLPLVLLLLTERPNLKPNLPRWSGRLARVALPLALLLVLPLAANAQALSGANPGHLRVVWTVDPAHRATVSWSTSSAGTTHEVYLDTQPRGGNLSAYARKVKAATNGVYLDGGASYHHADVTGLEPSTTYYFVVVSDGKASPERHFLTAPADDRPFRLLSGGDSRSGIAERRRINQLMARQLDQDPGIIAFAHGGDYNENPAVWSEWSGWLEDHALTFSSNGRVLPIIPARGNHEGDAKMFNQVFGFPGGTANDYYVTKLGANVTFITLDTAASIGGDQSKWLEQQLQAAQSSRWIVPSYHRPAFPAVKTASGALQFWVPLFEKYNVDVVCESDGHVLKRTVPIRNGKQDPTGIVYVGEGGLGVSQRTPVSQWYLKAPGMAKSAHHVQVFSFTPEKLVYEARGINGNTEDTYSFQPRRTGTSTPAPTPTPAPAPAEAPALASVTARSETQVAVTFSLDLDPASAVLGAFQLAPAAEVRDVALEGARTVVLTTGALRSGGEYVLSVTGVRSSAGGTLAGTAKASFVAPTKSPEPEGPPTSEPTPSEPTTPTPTPSEPTTPAPSTPAPTTPEPSTPETPEPSTPEAQPEVPLDEVDGQRPPSAGCSSVAGGAWVWASVAFAALAARKRRRSRPSA